MRFLILLLVASNLYAKTVTLQDAPFEWLIAESIRIEATKDEHIEDSDLVQEIFATIDYDVLNDEITPRTTKEVHDLQIKLLEYIEDHYKHEKEQFNDQYYKWLNEKSELFPVTLYKTNVTKPGHYYFNHIHTDVSQDNSSLKWLKLSPAQTYKKIYNYIKRKNIKGTVAFTDHDTDRTYDILKPIESPILKLLRGVEWGGKTHMCLIGIKKDWDNLPHGREYAGEESIRQSRSSGGFRIVNHPNRKGPFPYTSWLDTDGIEVWNTVLENSPFLRFNIKRSDNRAAFEQWKNSLKTGKRYTAVAGSDFHFKIPCFSERTLIYPLNFVAGEELNTKEKLFNGELSFLTRPDSPRLTLEAKFSDKKSWSSMGQKISGKGEVEVRLYGDFSDSRQKIGGACYRVVNTFYKIFTFWKKQTWQIRFYNQNNEIIAKRNINPKWYNYKKHFKATFKMPVDGQELIRAEIWSINKKSKLIDLIAATNPVYINWK